MCLLITQILGRSYHKSVLTTDDLFYYKTNAAKLALLWLKSFFRMSIENRPMYSIIIKSPR